MEDYFDVDDSLNDTYDYEDYHTICDKEAVRSFGGVFLPIMYAVALVVGLSGNALMQVTRGRPGGNSKVRVQWLLVCVALWATACFLSLPELIFSTVKHSHYRMSCTAMYPAHMAKATKAALELLEVLLRFLVPFVVMAVCYSCVGRVLSRGAGGHRQKKWRALRVLLAVVAVFLLTQLPYTVVKLCRALDVIYGHVTDCDASKSLDYALQVTESLALTHACINPLLYACMGSSFRPHILKAAKRLGQSLGSHPRHPQEPAVEIPLNTCSQVQSQSASDHQDTSTFSI